MGMRYGSQKELTNPTKGRARRRGSHKSFNLIGVSLYGGFVGSEKTNDPQGSFEKTILSGEINSDSNNWSYHIIVFVNSEIKSNLHGFTVTKSNANLLEELTLEE